MRRTRQTSLERIEREPKQKEQLKCIFALIARESGSSHLSQLTGVHTQQNIPIYQLLHRYVRRDGGAYTGMCMNTFKKGMRHNKGHVHNNS